MPTRARRRTIEHLHKLAAAAAVVGGTACHHGCGGTGYAVVDPMPMPTPTYGKTIVATVAWSGTRLSLELKDPTAPGALFSIKSPVRVSSSGAYPDAGLGTAIGGRIVSASITKDGLAFELEPDPGHGGMSVDVEVDGAGGVHTVTASIDWGTALDGGRALRVTMVDR